MVVVEPPDSLKAASRLSNRWLIAMSVPAEPRYKYISYCNAHVVCWRMEYLLFFVLGVRIGLVARVVSSKARHLKSLL